MAAALVVFVAAALVVFVALVVAAVFLAAGAFFVAAALVVFLAAAGESSFLVAAFLVAAGFAAATGTELPQAVEPEAPAKAEVVAINIRLPKDMHRTLRRIAFDDETSINALLIAAAEKLLAERG